MADDMVNKEEKILFPMSIETLSDAEWGAIRAGEGEIGYAFIAGAGVAGGWRPAPRRSAGRASAATATSPLATGGLSLEAARPRAHALPVDFQYVDEHDQVRFYSEGERIFPRSPGVIGRKVQNCHPPSSVHKVQQIIDAFRAGEQEHRRVLDRARRQVPAHPLLRGARRRRRLPRRRRDRAGRHRHPRPRGPAPAARLVTGRYGPGAGPVRYRPDHVPRGDPAMYFQHGTLSPEQTSSSCATCPSTSASPTRTTCWCTGAAPSTRRCDARFIGRDVRDCHPENTLECLEEILRQFKDGTKDVAEGWEQRGARFKYTRYAAVRDDAGAYKGILEVNQDITAVRALDGAQRLPGW